MTKILCIETATETCSVCLSENRKIMASKTSNDKKSHASLLTVFIKDIFEQTKLSLNDIDAVAVSMGPGSYTGLRIGVSAAKGIAYGTNKPLISVSTLKAMAQGFINKNQKTIVKENPVLVPMIDARRMEVYTSSFDKNINELSEITAEIIDENSFREGLEKSKHHIFGNGAEKCREILKHSNAIIYNNFEMSAENMINEATDLFEKKEFANLAYFEPYYLKDFVAKKSKDILDQLIKSNK